MELFPEIPVEELFEMISRPQIFLKSMRFDYDGNSLVRGEEKLLSICKSCLIGHFEKKVSCTPFPQTLHYGFQLRGD